MNEHVQTRVLVALDCANPSSDALQQLMHLLGSERLELTGLYIEDEDLMRAARLPGLREISLSGRELELNLERLQQDIASDLVRIRSAFERVARDLRLRFRFEVARGHAAETLCAAAAESDFVLVSRTVRASGLRPRSAPHYGQLLLQTKRILFVNEPWASGTSVVVLGDEPEGMAAGQRLAAAESLNLVVALPPNTRRTPQVPGSSTVVDLSDWSEDAIADLCLQHNARLLIVPGNVSLDTAALLTRLMDRLPCSLLKLA